MDDGSALALVIRQLGGIHAWNEARRHRERLLRAPGRSRERQLDAARDLAVLQRVQDAVIRRASEALSAEPSPLASPRRRHAVIAHRQEWFVQQVSAALAEHDVGILAVTDNAADALGVVIAEQPDLFLVEDTLAMLTGAEVIAETARFAVLTRVAAQVPDRDRLTAMLTAGAQVAFTRRVPPADVVDGLVVLLTAQRWAADDANVPSSSEWSYASWG